MGIQSYLNGLLLMEGGQGKARLWRAQKAKSGFAIRNRELKAFPK